jgi:RimJ/RimL family protein N-acetyltransferase
MPAAAERPLSPVSPDSLSPWPPERVAAGPLVLRRMHVDDAEEIALAVGASLDHLRPWMPWATPEAADRRNQRSRIAEADEMWDAGSAFIYVMIPAGSGQDEEVAGTIGLHRRVGENAIEIGYWTAVAHTRRGYATAAARALTSVAMALPGIRHVEIHCDEANTASAAIPRSLGYRLDRVEAHEREAPGESGRRMIWIWEPSTAPEWSPGPTGRAARAGA